MKKYMKFNIFGLIFLLLVLGSCSKFETPSQNPSPIVPPNDSYPLVKLSLITTGPIIQGDTITYAVSLNKPIESALTFTPVVDTVVSTAIEGVDFDFGDAITIPAYDTVAIFQVVTYADILPNDAKTLSFSLIDNIVGEKNLISPDNVFKEVSVSIANFVSDNLDLEFSWAKDIDLGAAGVYSTSNNVDFDVYISDAAGFDIANPWATFNSTIYAATGDEPEVMTITPGLLPDGKYVFWFDLWANGFWGYGNTTEIPVTSWVYKAGTSLNYTIQQDPAGIINANTPGYADDTTSHNAVLLRIEISGTTYTVSDYAGNVVGSGKNVAVNSAVGFINADRALRPVPTRTDRVLRPSSAIVRLRSNYVISHRTLRSVSHRPDFIIKTK